MTKPTMVLACVIYKLECGHYCLSDNCFICQEFDDSIDGMPLYSDFICKFDKVSIVTLFY